MLLKQFRTGFNKFKSGTNLKLNKTLKNRIRNMKIYGNSEQDVRSGKNLLNNTATTQTINGVTFTVKLDKSITIIGTATARTEPDICTSLTLKAGITYKNVTGRTLYFYSGGYMTIGNNSLYTPSNDINFSRVYIRVEIGEIVNTTIYPMLIINGTNETYEQYGASPTPEYPSEIKSVGRLVTSGEYTGKYKLGYQSNNRNLFSEKTFLWYDSSLKQITNAEGTGFRSIIGKVYENGTYIISKKNISNRFTILITKQKPVASVSYQNIIVNPSIKTYSFYAAKGDWIFLGVCNDTNIEQQNLAYENCMLEKGTTASTYVQYQNDTKAIYLNEPLREIEVPNTENYNVVKDGKYYIADFVDWKNKNVVRRIAPYRINGTEIISLGGILENTYRVTIQALPGGLVTNNLKILCEQFKLGYWTGDNDDYEHIRSSIQQYPTLVSLNINKSRLTEVSLNGARTWLASNNITGTYILATPTETPFTAEQEAVANLMSFENYTEIIVDDEVEPLNIELNYKSKSNKES